MLFSLANRRGEQPVVLSFRSSRILSSLLVTTGRYSCPSCTHLRTLSTNAPHANGFCMRLHSFTFRQRHNTLRHLTDSPPGNPLNAPALTQTLPSNPPP